MKASEMLWAVVTTYKVGRPDSVVAVIPKPLRNSLNIQAGAKLAVKTDEHGRIILEPIKIQVRDKSGVP
jgi:AbrB family looped-hinge helix DNA binding protein